MYCVPMLPAKAMVSLPRSRVHVAGQDVPKRGGVDRNSNWQGVIDATDKVMSLDYIIEPNWKTNFEVNNEVSREIIFPITFGKSDGQSHALPYAPYLDPIALGMNIGTWNGVECSTRLCEAV